MANLGSNVKTAFLKGLEALGKTASSLTDAAQQKLSEMNIDNRRREVLAEIPKCVMQLWKDGVEMPEPLTSLLTELNELDEKLAALRPQPEAKPEEPVQTEEPAEEEEAEDTAVEAEEETACTDPGEETPACECSQEECLCEAAEAENQEE
ncbi:MAG: hypothetical protein IKU70_10550 [Clostridia bacterium]|nr:hypothetical protein [Clostridia bacterium]